MSPLAFFEQLADTPWSMALHESDIAYSILESTHVWSLVLFFGLVIVFDLRLLGWAYRKVPISEFSRRLLPWTVLGFVLMAVSGALLVYAIPVRSYQNLFFRFKMILMLLAGINVLIFHAGVYPGIPKWDNDAKCRRARAGLAGAMSLVLWVGIVVSGRMIAYNWFDCDRQPQSDIINLLTSCTPTE